MHASEFVCLYIASRPCSRPHAHFQASSLQSTGGYQHLPPNIPRPSATHSPGSPVPKRHSIPIGSRPPQTPAASFKSPYRKRLGPAHRPSPGSPSAETFPIKASDFSLRWISSGRPTILSASFGRPKRQSATFRYGRFLAGEPDARSPDITACAVRRVSASWPGITRLLERPGRPQKSPR